LKRRIWLVVVLLLVAASLGGASVSAQSGMNRAAIIARFADGQNLVKCVQFSEASISGEELLRRTGWTIVIDADTDQGAAICKVNETGCEVDDCFCRCRGGSQCEYWSYWHWIGDEWEYSDWGATDYDVTDGALEGWSWGPGNWVTGTEPPAFTFEQICNANTTQQPAGNTPEPRQDLPPSGDFESEELTVARGACTVLDWVIFDAEQVTLDGAPVDAQDRLEVCPTETRRYVLVATNAIGQLTRELTITVSGDAPPASPPQGAPTTAPPPQPPQQQPTLPPVNPEGAGPSPILPPPNAEFTPAPGPILDAPPQAVEVTATPIIRPAVTDTPPAFVLTLTAFPTPVLVARAQSDTAGDERPSPTPILVALAGGAASAEQVAARPAAAQTAFDPALLPGYGVFLLMMAGLLGAAAWVWQRGRAR